MGQVQGTRSGDDFVGLQKLIPDTAQKLIFFQFLEDYWRTASKTMDAPDAVTNLPFLDVQAESEEEHIICYDIWLVEMKYEICVSRQRSTWEKRGPDIIKYVCCSFVLYAAL